MAPAPRSRSVRAPRRPPDPTSESEDPDALDALDACARIAIQPGHFDKLEGHAAARDSNADGEPAAIGRRSVALDGFNLHAAVAVGADDDVARERLVRYCARPPFALERLSLLPDGRVAYRIKQPRRNATHRILEPVELLARIAALIPPPRHPFLRYHGVLAPSSKWRRHIVPRPLQTDSMQRAPHAVSAPSRASPPHNPPTPNPPTPTAPTAPTAPIALAIRATTGVFTAPKSPAQPSTPSAVRSAPPAAAERRPGLASPTVSCWRKRRASSGRSSFVARSSTTSSRARAAMAAHESSQPSTSPTKRVASSPPSPSDPSRNVSPTRAIPTKHRPTQHSPRHPPSPKPRRRRSPPSSSHRPTTDAAPRAPLRAPPPSTKDAARGVPLRSFTETSRLNPAVRCVVRRRGPLSTRPLESPADASIPYPQGACGFERDVGWCVVAQNPVTIARSRAIGKQERTR